MEDPHTQTDNNTLQNTEMASFPTESLKGEGTNGHTDLPLQEETAQIIRSLLTEMQQLRRDFDTKVKYDESKERQIDSLHRELQEYREGLHFKILRPLFIDLIAVYDDFGKLIEDMSNKEADQAPAQTVENLKSFQETIADILHRNGVEAYNVEGDTHVPSRQRVLQVINTIDPARDKQVARRIRKGFEYDNRVIRPELIATYKAVQGKE
jgi:molecular chaperone GrpE